MARAPIPDYLEQISKAVVAAGARTVNIPDTVGYSTPDEYAALIGRIVQALGDTRGGERSLPRRSGPGCRQLPGGYARRVPARSNARSTASASGPATARSKRSSWCLKTRPDRFPYRTGIHTEHLFATSQLLSSIITFGPQPNKAIVGRNAFAHEAGIHQDGYLKEKTTYEIIDPQSVGVPEGSLVLGKHSGRHALKQRCEELGLALTREELETLYTEFTALADRKKGIMDEEILSIVQQSRLPTGVSSQVAGD